MHSYIALRRAPPQVQKRPLPDKALLNHYFDKVNKLTTARLNSRCYSQIARGVHCQVVFFAELACHSYSINCYIAQLAPFIFDCLFSMTLSKVDKQDLLLCGRWISRILDVSAPKCCEGPNYWERGEGKLVAG